MENAITKPISFQVGQVVRAQLGNEGESNYHPEADVEVLAIKGDSVGAPLYLVRPLNIPNLLATASDMCGSPIEEEIKGRLYSTNARVFGAGSAGEKFGFLTAAQAMKSLGF